MPDEEAHGQPEQPEQERPKPGTRGFELPRPLGWLKPFVLATESSAQATGIPADVDPAGVRAWVGGLHRDVLVELAVATQRAMSQSSWVNAVVCAAAAEAACRYGSTGRSDDAQTVATQLVDSALGERYQRSAHVADLALACGTTGHAIWQRVHRARALHDHLPATDVLHAAGVLDVRKTDVVLDAVIATNLPLRPDQVHRLDEVIAGRPDPLTPNPETGVAPSRRIRPILDPEHAPARDLAVALRRRVATLAGPRPVEDAHQAAKQEFCGVRLSPLPDGMATLTFTGTASDLWTVNSALDAVTDGSSTQKIEALTIWAKNALATQATPGAAGTSDGGGAHIPTALRPQIIVTIPADTLTTLDPDENDDTHGEDEGVVPADLLGYGPIPHSLFRDLAREATWRCGAVDPITGQLVALGHQTYSQRYTPTERLRRFLTVSWQRCCFPGCARRADACDIDHAENWPGGPTCECNLHPLCRFHHNLKTHTTWTVESAITATGARKWTSPTGRIYYTSQGIPETCPMPAGGPSF